jgi:hypothetical protein
MYIRHNTFLVVLMLIARDHCIVGARLQLNPTWNNPTGEWHIGYKLAYELFTETLVSRLKVVMSFPLDALSIVGHE